jgi:hypothetical protein
LITPGRINDIEALLRTVTGIATAEVVAHPAGGLAVVRVHCTDESSRGQVIRNVRSALLAGFGVAISAECIDFVEAAPDASAPEPSSAPAAAPVPVASPVPATVSFTEEYILGPVPDGLMGPGKAPQQLRVPRITLVDRGEGDVHALASARASLSAEGLEISTANGPNAAQVVAPAAPRTRPASAAVDARMEIAAETAAVDQHPLPVIAPVPATVGSSVREIIASAAALRLETVEMRRQAGRLRCRVVISLGNEHFGAVADSADPNTGEIHLAGRVACDALRAGGFTEARFDGAAVAHINGRQHVVVALSEWSSGETIVLSGAAALERIPERAAALAAIKAVLAQDIS